LTTHILTTQTVAAMPETVHDICTATV